MNTNISQLHIVIGADLETISSALQPVSLLLPCKRPTTLTIVTGGTIQDDFRSSIAASFAIPDRTTFIDATARLPRLLADLRIGRARRVAIDIDAVAPRLKQVALPREVAEADCLVAAVDLRADPRSRPDVTLALWSNLVSPAHRLAARLSGTREGLTAELLLARQPDLHIAVDALAKGGPVILIAGTDPVAVEVFALSVRNVRSTEPRDTPGPWEDALVQHATELQLGAPGPTTIRLTASIHRELDPAIGERIEAAAARAGISGVDWVHF